MKNDHYRKMKKDALAGLARKKRKGKISPGLETQSKFILMNKLFNLDMIKSKMHINLSQNN